MSKTLVLCSALLVAAALAAGPACADNPPYTGSGWSGKFTNMVAPGGAQAQPAGTTGGTGSTGGTLSTQVNPACPYASGAVTAARNEIANAAAASAQNAKNNENAVQNQVTACFSHLLDFGGFANLGWPTFSQFLDALGMRACQYAQGQEENVLGQMNSTMSDPYDILNGSAGVNLGGTTNVTHNDTSSQMVNQIWQQAGPHP